MTTHFIISPDDHGVKNGLIAAVGRNLAFVVIIDHGEFVRGQLIETNLRHLMNDPHRLNKPANANGWADVDAVIASHEGAVGLVPTPMVNINC